MTQIVGLAGSLRKASLNSALLRAAVELAPAGVSVEVGSIREIPLYDGDLEAQSGIPSAVVELKNRIAAADGLLLVTPEYNGSIPGVFKNAIDWLSRPASDISRVFGRKPVGLIGATPGPAGTRLSQTAWLAVLRQLGTNPWFGRSLFLASAGQAFDEAGALVDAKAQQLLRDYLAGFSAFVAATRSG